MSTRDIVKLLVGLKRELGTFVDVANHLGLHHSHVYNCVARLRAPSPTLLCALKEHGYLKEDKKRIRSQITWKSNEQKEAFYYFVKLLGYDSITDYCRDMADLYELYGTYKSGELSNDGDKEQ